MNQILDTHQFEVNLGPLFFELYVDLPDDIVLKILSYLERFTLGEYRLLTQPSFDISSVQPFFPPLFYTPTPRNHPLLTIKKRSTYSFCSIPEHLMAPSTHFSWMNPRSSFEHNALKLNQFVVFLTEGQWNDVDEYIMYMEEAIKLGSDSLEIANELFLQVLFFLFFFLSSFL